MKCIVHRSCCYAFRFTQLHTLARHHQTMLEHFYTLLFMCMRSSVFFFSFMLSNLWFCCKYSPSISCILSVRCRCQWLFFFQLQFTQSREEKNRQKKRPYFSTTTQIAEIKITKHIWKLKHSSNAIFSVYFLGTRFGCCWLFSAYDVRVGLWCCISYL